MYLNVLTCKILLQYLSLFYYTVIYWIAECVFPVYILRKTNHFTPKQVLKQTKRSDLRYTHFLCKSSQWLLLLIIKYWEYYIYLVQILGNLCTSNDEWDNKSWRN